MFETVIKPSAIYDPAYTGSHDCVAFKRVQVLMAPHGGHMIAWELRDGFKENGPYQFYVDFGRSAIHNEWEVLNHAPVVDECVFVDAKQRHWDELADFYYRIRLVLPGVRDPITHQPKLYYSHPQQANGILNKNDWLIAREICRKEYLLQNKRTNQTNRGYLFKRRRWGQPCPICLEYDSGDSQTSRCPTCYSTGFTGGYFKAVDFTVRSDEGWERGFLPTVEQGYVNNVVKNCRAVAYPYIDNYDVYMRRDNGERYVIDRPIKSMAEIGGVPLIVTFPLRIAPVTDIVYNIPLAGGSSSASGGSSATPSSAVGINADEWV